MIAHNINGDIQQNAFEAGKEKEIEIRLCTHRWRDKHVIIGR